MKRYAIFRIPNLGQGYDNSPSILEDRISTDNSSLKIICDTMNAVSSSWESFGIFEIDKCNKMIIPKQPLSNVKHDLPPELKGVDLSSIKTNTSFGKYLVIVDESNLGLGCIIVNTENWPKESNGFILDVNSIEKHVFKPLKKTLDL